MSEAPTMLGLVCQSCGMPLARDPQGGGTEADGSRSTKYCSRCYELGAFTLPDLTADMMVERVAGMLRSRDMPEAQVQALTAGIPTLERWQA